MLVTDTVWKECADLRSGGTAIDASERVALMSGWATKATILTPGGPESGTAAALLAQGDLEEGEVSILAWAIHHPDVIPVLHERQAILRAVEELPERNVLSFHGFLGLLRKQGLNATVAGSISKWYCSKLTGKNGSRPKAPQWW